MASIFSVPFEKVLFSSVAYFLIGSLTDDVGKKEPSYTAGRNAS
jgi:hypothetical protein